MVVDLIEEGYLEGKDLNCAESILYAANEAYDMDLSKKCLILSAGFGGGMGIEAICGALSGSVMTIGYLFVEDRAHASEVYDLGEDFLNRFERKMGSLDCGPLKEQYRTEDDSCYPVILSAAEVLDEFISEHSGQRVR